MNKIIYTLFFSLMLLGCVATASTIKNNQPIPRAQIIEHDSKEMLEFEGINDYVDP